MNLVRCTALVAFTHFVAGYGMVHGDPDNSDNAARFPIVPEDAVEHLVREGRLSVEDAPVAGPVPAPVPPTVPAEAQTITFTATYVPVGRWKIEGSNGHSETLKGSREDADERIAELEKASAGEQVEDAPIA